MNICRVNLDKVVTIKQNNIEIDDEELEKKKMKLTFRNFGDYFHLDLKKRAELQATMKKWLSSNSMRL